MEILSGSNDMAKNVTKILAYIYLFGWIASGLSTKLVGVIFYPYASKTLSDIGTSWLGLAVAAGNSFFGIRPQNTNA